MFYYMESQQKPHKRYRISPGENICSTPTSVLPWKKTLSEFLLEEIGLI